MNLFKRLVTKEKPIKESASLKGYMDPINWPGPVGCIIQFPGIYFSYDYSEFSKKTKHLVHFYTRSDYEKSFIEQMRLYLRINFIRQYIYNIKDQHTERADKIRNTKDVDKKTIQEITEI